MVLTLLSGSTPEKREVRAQIDADEMDRLEHFLATVIEQTMLKKGQNNPFVIKAVHRERVAMARELSGPEERQ